ncbi:MAG: WecB/TagA/CpsF family glycosyltransferase [bacterium]|nr:WecB/TagA/CpsF family glycosyltransferase [bacterium]
MKKSELLNSMMLFLEDGKKHHIVTTNPEFIMEAQVNEQFKSVINSADISLIDGAGILAAVDYAQRRNRSKSYFVSVLQFIGRFIRTGIQKQPVEYQGRLLERITGVDLVLLLVQQEWLKGRRVYLLGGKDNVSALALRRLQQINPDVQFRSSNGVKNIKNPDSREEATILADINNFYPDVLLVAYGHPWQDLWIASNRDTAQFRIAVGVGGTFDYLAGRIPRAPLFVRKMALEWLFRLLYQPLRFKRIWTATWSFVRKVVTNDTILS